MTTKYPEIKVQLTGEDGNAFGIIGKVQRALRKASVAKKEIDAFVKEATSGDYHHLLNTCMQMVDVH